MAIDNAWGNAMANAKGNAKCKARQRQPQGQRQKQRGGVWGDAEFSCLQDTTSTCQGDKTAFDYKSKLFKRCKTCPDMLVTHIILRMRMASVHFSGFSQSSPYLLLFIDNHVVGPLERP